MPSTVIASFCYNPQKQQLEVTFLSGNVYCYYKVPKRIYDGLLRSISKGRYFNRCIKNKYRYKRIYE